MPEIAVMDNTGDTKIIWSADKPDEVENAKETFKRLRGKGYLVYAVKGDGSKGKQVHEFDPDAEKLIFIPPVVGG